MPIANRHFLGSPQAEVGGLGSACRWASPNGKGHQARAQGSLRGSSPTLVRGGRLHRMLQHPESAIVPQVPLPPLREPGARQTTPI